ncbi:MAG: branched-chain amino acid transport system substrate-binding protein [Gaiellaceae bacterium]|nr:branched-chain amino acid transport system substrate-binding protein [Gaiellaceae bacterium]
MGSKVRIFAAVAGAAIVASVAVTAAFGGHRATPGVTATEIKIGGTFPLTGVASLYKTIPAAEKAYFDYVNDHGGVNGRKINFEILDDSYDPSKTVPAAQQLVEKDGVFAVFGSLGTAPGLATWGYLNSKKVPQVLLATGDSYWGFSKKKYPWTMGWQPDYPGEAKLYGKYIAANMPNAKVGVLYQNDAFGKNYYAGLRVGLGAKKGNIVDAESYDATQPSVTQQILALKSKGADTLVVFATPTPAITALVTAAKVGWTPTATFLGNVSANRIFLLAAAKNGANVDGVISSVYTASATTQQSLAGVKLAQSIINQYAPSLQGSFAAGDGNIIYGFGAEWTFVYALQHSGKNPSRASLMAALHNLNTTKNPFVYPGIKLQTSLTDNFPIEQEIMVKWAGGGTGDWQSFGKLLDGIR